MRLRSRLPILGGIALFSMVFAGCGVRANGPAKFGGNQPTLLTPEQAADTSYRYAFTGQVRNALTGEVLKNFQVGLVGGDSKTSLVNALGEATGIFHVSRTTSGATESTQTPAVISAPGFEPVVQLLNVGVDCLKTDCKGSKALPVLLKPLLNSVTGNSNASNILSTGAVTDLLKNQGAQELFNQLLSQGKLDSTASNVLANSKVKDLVGPFLVLLNQGQTAGTADLVSQLLKGVGGDKLKGLGNGSGLASTLIPLIASTNPQMGAALLAVNALLPYLQPIVSGQGTNSPLAGILGTLLQNNSQAPLGNLAGLLQLANGKNPQLAGFASLANLFLNSSGQQQNPFLGLLSGALQNQNLATLLGSVAGGGKDKNLQTLVTLLQPLLQGLGGTNGTQLSSLFNELIQNGGLAALKDLGNNPDLSQKFAALMPFIEPLIRGLNSKNGTALAGLLTPILSKGDPSGALLGLLNTSGGKLDTAKLTQLVQTLFPALPNVLNGVVPGKQVIGAQILQGLLNGDLKNLQVLRDLPGVSGVVVSGQAADVFKLAQLSSVAKLIKLPK